MADLEEEVASSYDEGDDDIDEEEKGTEGDDTETADNEDPDYLDDDAPARFGHLPRSVYAELSAADQVSKWHSSLLPVEVDLIDELDGSNLFFINAESLIVEFLYSKEVQFLEETQFLRMMYAIEFLLHGIKSCEGTFRLVFFDATKKVLTSSLSESVWAFRQAFLCHCRAKNIDHVVFPHWYCKEWKEHVTQWRPSFFLVCNDAIEVEEDEEEEEDAEEKPMMREMFRAFLLSCLSMKCHVALTSGLQRRGNRMMGFTVQADCYDSWVDHNVQTAYLPLLEEEDEDEEEDDVVAALKEFAASSKDSVGEDALLRSFLEVTFAESTLKMMKGQNETTVQLMKLVVKALLLQEMFLRQIPLDKRAFSIPPAEDWSFYEDKILSGALGRYFEMVGKALGKIVTDDSTAVPLDSCDLFDGRMYRFLFHAIVQQGMSAKGKVDNDFFGLQPWVVEELDFLWKKVSKDKFFPMEMSAILDFEDLAPPDMPPQEKARPKASLQTYDNEFLGGLWQDFKFSTIEETAEESKVAVACELWDAPYSWQEHGKLDSLKAEEHMEENEAEKRFRQRFENKKKITAWDLDFQKKFQLKKRQQALKALAGYAKSLTGSDKLHHPIIMKDIDSKAAKDPKAKAEPEPAKRSQKAQELIDKRNAEEEAKIKASDAESLKAWEKNVDAIGEIGEPEKFEKEILDMLVGFNRITDSFERFPVVSNTFKTTEAQAKLLVKVVKSCRNSLKKMQLDRLPAANQSQARRVVQYFFCIIQEAFKSYGRKDIDGKGIKLFQECLIAIGFPKSAKNMFAAWKEAQKPPVEVAPPAAADKKDDKKDKKGKDDKKDKKDDKKDKKDDKKDKKSKDKDDDGDAGDPSQFEVKKEVDSLWSGVGADEMAFQMLHLGPYMTRVTGNSKDERVNFRPDKWQRDLLDIVDGKESALIVAPTASGKTFIGYYVMDKVLREDNDGVAVYVAPSKALVNQVSAEIYARFSSKTYPSHSKNELLGVFLREYNSAGGVMEAGKWKNCQVLVTIPHILEMLLMSPSSQDWVKRLKYIVFDEVHCIGEKEGGEQWEHGLQTIPCPFLALSATVADPSFFHGWLSAVGQRKEQADVKMVQYTERWNDLYKYIFSQGTLRPLHPFCCLGEQSVKKNGLASDMTLTPMEMVQLYLEVNKVIGKHKIWDQLLPADYFGAKGVGYITKKDAREYEKLLKESFLQIISDGTISSEAFDKVIVGLQSGSVAESGKQDNKEKFQPPSRTQDNELPDFRTLSKGSAYLKGDNIVRLCRDLSDKQYLPAIVFNFSRKEIETILKRMIQELKDQQHNKYYGDEEATYRSRKIMAQRMAEYERKKVEYEQAIKARASMNQESNAARKNNDGEGGRVKAGGNNDMDLSLKLAAETMLEPQPPEDLADEIDMEFSFHSPKAYGQWIEDIKDLMKELERKKTAKYLMDGLRRGIGMHHEGCKTAYKQAVEVLFRRGFLRVVFATNTLALGINMPCRSTIFCGDSLELNGLAYRQMAGRAGRRGFDLLGQVVFLDMSFLKVQRLVGSDMSKLTGQFTLSPTTLLRALSACEQTNLDITAGKTVARNPEEMLRTLSPLFSLPFYSSPGAELDIQVPYHTRFSLQLLRQEGLLDQQGNTRGLANMVWHLFEVEPANFILNRLLASGLLHEYLSNEKEKVVKGIRRTHLTVKLTAILAWFLFPKRLPKTFAKSQPRKKHIPSEDCPCLPQLPEKILEEVQRYNASVFELFQELSFSVASTRKYVECDFTLPHSERHFNESWESRGPPFTKESKFQKPYTSQITRFRARTPLAAIAGEGDRFSSPTDLVTTLRNIIQMDLNAIPMVHLQDTNSWALDFMIHGKMKVLWEDNGIDSTQAYKLIKLFEDIVKMVIDALKAYKPAKDDIVLTTFEELSAELKSRREGGAH